MDDERLAEIENRADSLTVGDFNPMLGAAVVLVGRDVPDLIAEVRRCHLDAVWRTTSERHAHSRETLKLTRAAQEDERC